jgi:hypothetical protein
MCSLPLSLTVGAEPKKIQAMIRDFEACFRNQFLGHALNRLQIGVDDLLAFGADEMRMGVRFVAVVAVASLGKPQLQHLVQFFKKGHGLVNRGQACRGETLFHLLVDVLDTRVPVTGRQNLEHGHALGRDSRIVPLQRFQHLIVTCLWTSHSYGIRAARIMENNSLKKIIQY